MRKPSTTAAGSDQSPETRTEEGGGGEVGDETERYLAIQRDGHGQRFCERHEGDEQEQRGHPVGRERGQGKQDDRRAGDVHRDDVGKQPPAGVRRRGCACRSVRRSRGKQSTSVRTALV